MKRLLPIIVFLLCAPDLFAQIAVVQSVGAYQTTGTNTGILTVTSTTANTLLVVGAYNYDSRTISGVSDGTTAFTQGTSTQCTRAVGVVVGDLWFLPVANSGKTTITVTFSGTSTGKSLWFWEVSGFTLPIRDVSSCTTDGLSVGDKITGPTATTTASAGFVAAIVSQIGGIGANPYTGNEFTAGGSKQDGNGGVSLISASAAAHIPEWEDGLGGGNQFTASVIAFKETPGGSVAPKKILLLGVGD